MLGNIQCDASAFNSDEYTDDPIFNLEIVRWVKAFQAQSPQGQRAMLFRARIRGYPSANAAFGLPARLASLSAAFNGDGTHDAEEAFRNAAAEFDITLPAKLIPGEWQHFNPATGDNVMKKDAKGWCKFDKDEKGGIFGDFKRGISKGWRFSRGNGHPPSPEERQRWKRQDQDAERQLWRGWKEVAATAAGFLKFMQPASPDHPYLAKKGVKPHGGLLQHNGKLYLRLVDIDNATWSYQSLDVNGKYYCEGGRTKGCSFTIGDITTETTTILVAEGYATAATLHEVTGHPVIVALNCGNLLEVVKAFRKKYQFKTFIICADVDSWTQGNPGKSKADEAARAIRGKVAKPEWSKPRDINGDETDFNGLRREEGDDAVRACIEAAREPERAPNVEKEEDPVSLPDVKAAVERLKKLDRAAYDQRRKQEAKDLGDIRVSTLDALVEEARQKDKQHNRQADQQSAYAPYVTKPDFPPDNIGAIAGMEIEVTVKGDIVSRSYVNAAISIAKRLNIRGQHDIFHNRIWIAFKGELLLLDDKLTRTIHTEVANNLGTEGGITNVRNALHYLAELNAFHPVRRRFDALKLKWDKKPRLKTWLKMAFGCEEPNEYLERVGEMFLVSMVARIKVPGCQVDYVLIIEGDQGLQKSSALRLLALDPEWFSDSLPTLNARNEIRTSMHMRGKLLCEIPEMHASGSADTDYGKAFITRRVEKYTPLYGRAESYEPRQCVFAGTTNKTAYFTDESGNRRYWPVYAHKVDLGWLKENVEQLLGEAVDAYDNGVTWWPTPEFEKEWIKPQQDDRRVEIALATPIKKYLDNDEFWPVGEKGFQFEIWEHLKRNSASKSDIDFSQPVLRDINAALRHLGYTNKARRYPDAEGKRVMTRKWWPPEEKMSEKVKDGLNPPF